MKSKTESGLRIEAALERFSLQLEANGRSRHTIDQYRRHVRLLARWLEDGRRNGSVGAVGHETLAAFLASPAVQRRSDGRRRKATSANALRTSLRCFFGYLHGAGYIPGDPARLIQRARCGSRHVRALSEDEQERLLKALDGAQIRDRVLFTLMLRTGIRVGSAVGLDVDDVDLDGGELRLRRAKGDREERVFLPDSLRTDLDGLMGRRTGCQTAHRQDGSRQRGGGERAVASGL